MNEISMPNQYKTEKFNDKHVYDDIDIVQQIPQTSANHKRFAFLSKLPFVCFIRIYYVHLIVVHYRFFHKSEKAKKPEARRLKMFEIYRFADKLDVLLMIIGTTAG
jgi:hypothetical protein